MMARIRKSMAEKDKGFTLVELLVVMIIVGILAAIAIPVFLNQRKKAADTAAKSDVSTLGKELATYYVDNQGTPPALAVAGGQYTMGGVALGPVSKGVSNPVASTNNATTGTDWCVQVSIAEGTKTTVAYSSKVGLGALGSTCTAGVLTAPAAGA